MAEKNGESTPRSPSFPRLTLPQEPVGFRPRGVFHGKGVRFSQPAWEFRRSKLLMGLFMVRSIAARLCRHLSQCIAGAVVQASLDRVLLLSLSGNVPLSTRKCAPPKQAAAVSAFLSHR
ncbi:unnamed protein product [Effrenium voratum]|nr:unnamed protein product [Effrenium voratum]